jgi:hypothetical protein
MKYMTPENREEYEKVKGDLVRAATRWVGFTLQVNGLKFDDTALWSSVRKAEARAFEAELTLRHYIQRVISMEEE